jgi:hypothetical protein
MTAVGAQDCVLGIGIWWSVVPCRAVMTAIRGADSSLAAKLASGVPGLQAGFASPSSAVRFCHDPVVEERGQPQSVGRRNAQSISWQRVYALPERRVTEVARSEGFEPPTPDS